MKWLTVPVQPSYTMFHHKTERNANTFIYDYIHTATHYPTLWVLPALQPPELEQAKQGQISGIMGHPLGIARVFSLKSIKFPNFQKKILSSKLGAISQTTQKTG